MYHRDKALVMERRSRALGILCALVTAAIGGWHFAAWITGEMYYRGFQAITMKANAALCLLLCGTALALTAHGGGGRSLRRVARLLAGIAMTIGVLTLLEHLFALDFRIDQLIAEEPPGALAIIHPNRMGPPGAVSFALGGFALLLLHRKGGAVRLAQCIGILVCFIGLLTFLGYVYGAQPLFGAARYTAIAWPTTIALFLLGLGILVSRPGEGVMALVTSADPGGAAARRLLPAALILPIILGWLRLQGEWHGFYDRYFGTSILVLSWIFVFSFLIYKTAAWTSRWAEALRMSERRYRSFVEASAQVVWRVNEIGAADEEIPEWQEYTGQSGEEARGFGWLNAIRPEDRPRVLEAWQRAATMGDLYEVEYVVRRGDGEWRNFLARGVPIFHRDGSIREWIGTGIDITEQTRAREALRRSEEQFRQLAEALPMLVWMAGARGEVEYLNARWFEYTGSSGEESLGTGWSRFLHGDDLSGAVARWEGSVESGEPYEAEYRIRRADGEYHWFIARAVAVRSEGGRVARWFGSCTDIQDQKRARDLAEAAARTKSDFMANMSHEIRTPMNGIVGVTGLLLETELSDLQRQYLEMVKGSADALLSVVNDVLDFSKMEAGAVRLDSVDFDLHETVENVAEALSVLAFQKGLEFAVLIAPDLPGHFVGDPAKLRQVLMNLVGNAVKFTDTGEVAVRVDGAPSEGERWRLTFSVLDTGIGIPEEKQGVLFRSFSQVDTSRARSYGGTGLGLAISGRLVELMGGRISVQSRPGEGSTFSFTIELPPAQGVPSAKVQRWDALAGLRLLVVDDNETNRLMLQQSLSSRGVEVETAECGSDAVARFLDRHGTDHPFNLILLDMHLPDMDGVEVVRRLSERVDVERSVIFMITSDRIAPCVRGMRELGMTAYLVKPIRVHALLKEVMQLRAEGEVERREEVERTARPDLLCTHVLVAEDNPVNLTVTEALLRGAGARVTAATNGVEAVDAGLSGKYDVVLMDVQMPEMDGIEATRLLREKGFAAPIIGLTAHALDGDQERCIAAGMNDYLSKPVSPGRLAAKVADWARRTSVPAEVGTLLYQLEGDRETFQLVVATFVENAPLQLAEVQAAAGGSDAEKLERAAHRLKGALSVVAADTARCMAEKLEHSARKGDLSQAKEIAAQLEAEVSRVLERLREVEEEGGG